MSSFSQASPRINNLSFIIKEILYKVNYLETVAKPYVEILPLGIEGFNKASNILKTYNINPSDALHIAVMMNNSISKIASEDKGLDKIQKIKRVWIQ